MIGETVFVLTAAQSTNPYTGVATDDWTLTPAGARAVVTVAPPEPRPGNEPLQGALTRVARNTVVSGWTLFLPAGDPITPQQHVQVRGVAYPVQGEPADWPDLVVVQAFKTEG